MVSKHSPCFSDKIEAWDFGPVVVNVYHNFKIFGGAVIQLPSKPSTYEQLLPKLDYKTAEIVEFIFDDFIGRNYNNSQWNSIIRNQAPFNSARKSYSQIISNESLEIFFGQ